LCCGIKVSGKILIIGNGGIKRVKRYEDDPILLDIVNKLRSIEHQIFIGTRKIHADYDDYQKVKIIIEAISI